MKFLSIALLTAMSAVRAHAAEPIPADVEAFTREYLVAMQTEGQAGAVRFLHPEAQRALKAQLMRGFQEGEQASYTLRRTFGESATRADLERMPDDEFLVKVLGGNASESGDAGKMIRLMEIVGVVREGEIVHVVNRTVADLFGSRLTNVSVTTLKRHGKEWRALLMSSTESVPPEAGRQNDAARPPALPPPPPTPRR